jgi:PEP-CTERM motif
MKNSLRFSLLAAAAALAFSTQANAALVPATTPCANTDIVINAIACAGFFQGNLIAGSPAAIADQTAALASLGFAWNGNFAAAEKISPLNGSHTVNFATPLNGTTYVAFHFGAGGVPGRGGATAFYKLNAGVNLDTLTLAKNASSGAILYSTGPAPAVPEPAAWGLLLAGFGVAGSAMRRRRTTVVYS